VEYANGNYNEKAITSRTKEVQVLSSALQDMAIRLREREEQMSYFANYDSLTGLQNTTSYKAWVDKFNAEIKNENVKFGVIMFDLNNLKETNDKYGHNIGDKLIITAAKIISDTYDRCPLFRVGGDEFVVVLQNEDLEGRKSLFDQLILRCSNTFVEVGDDKVAISIAMGFSMFDPNKDQRFEEVLKRADEAMYENKLKMKNKDLL
jgi:diguanylate cyclase (GGDEF)-like protein